MFMVQILLNFVTKQNYFSKNLSKIVGDGLKAFFYECNKFRTVVAFHLNQNFFSKTIFPKHVVQVTAQQLLPGEEFGWPKANKKFDIFLKPSDF